MKAVTYQHPKEIEVKQMPDPKLERADDIIVRVTTTAICGSDLHLVHGLVPGLYKDYVIGHEPVGIVEEVGKDVTKVRKGDRVVIPFNVSCGVCRYCSAGQESQCDNSNPHGESGAYLGYSDTYGGYPGGQAELLRVPYANFMPFVIPEHSEVTDEQAVMLSDVLPTAYWSVDNAGVKDGDTVIVLGCGPIGLMTQKFAWLKGAKRVIAVDYLPYRLQQAKAMNLVETFNIEDFEGIGDHLKEITGGGADVVIDCVGLDGKRTVLEWVETALMLQGGSMGAIQIASQCVRKSGTIHLTGVYGLRYNAFPLGDLFSRNITLKMGQAPVIHYMPYLFELIESGRIDPSAIITHRLPLDQAKHAYNLFDHKQEDCIKVILNP
ncbi:zinc-dependent alcohol dehydrogenase [Paenibacillus chartarius]|uniref:Zinc-dependent alcohol dehydrogenase n=1 Tax=Paenibacillus chartarius TaxID=747481 RepID=A0ABV6DPX3_9BACL